ncbi:NRT2 ribosyltransferase, partial [Gymnorhina tibicen]|nr:NRT2 ribosyltransferase [Gymnorhina tibicen]
VATTAIEEKPLDMAQNSFDDQYHGCGPAMTAALPALKRSELQQNPQFAEVWAGAAERWQAQGSSWSPLSSQDQAIALTAYLTNDLYYDFIVAMREAGRSSREYRDNFHFKALHFLLTDAMATLRDAQGQQCHCAVQEVTGVQFKAKRGDTVRFGQFTSMSLCNETSPGVGKDTVFQVQTCYGVDIPEFFYYYSKKEVLIPPFEAFKVTNVTQDGDQVRIWLRSAGTFSNYNCEWLRGDVTEGTTWGDG